MDIPRGVALRPSVRVAVGVQDFRESAGNGHTGRGGVQTAGDGHPRGVGHARGARGGHTGHGISGRRGVKGHGLGVAHGHVQVYLRDVRRDGVRIVSDLHVVDVRGRRRADQPGSARDRVRAAGEFGDHHDRVLRVQVHRRGLAGHDERVDEDRADLRGGRVDRALGHRGRREQTGLGALVLAAFEKVVHLRVGLTRDLLAQERAQVVPVGLVEHRHRALDCVHPGDHHGVVQGREGRVGVRADRGLRDRRRVGLRVREPDVHVHGVDPVGRVFGAGGIRDHGQGPGEPHAGRAGVDAQGLVQPAHARARGGLRGGVRDRAHGGPQGGVARGDEVEGHPVGRAVEGQIGHGRHAESVAAAAGTGVLEFERLELVGREQIRAVRAGGGHRGLADGAADRLQSVREPAVRDGAHLVPLHGVLVDEHGARGGVSAGQVLGDLGLGERVRQGGLDEADVVPIERLREGEHGQVDPQGRGGGRLGRSQSVVEDGTCAVARHGGLDRAGVRSVDHPQVHVRLVHRGHRHARRGRGVVHEAERQTGHGVVQGHGRVVDRQRVARDVVPVDGATGNGLHSRLGAGERGHADDRRARGRPGETLRERAGGDLDLGLRGVEGGEHRAVEAHDVGHDGVRAHERLGGPAGAVGREQHDLDRLAGGHARGRRRVGSGRELQREFDAVRAGVHVVGVHVRCDVDVRADPARRVRFDRGGEGGVVRRQSLEIVEGHQVVLVHLLVEPGHDVGLDDTELAHDEPVDLVAYRVGRDEGVEPVGGVQRRGGHDGGVAAAVLAGDPGVDPGVSNGLGAVDVAGHVDDGRDHGTADGLRRPADQGHGFCVARVRVRVEGVAGGRVDDLAGDLDQTGGLVERRGDLGHARGLGGRVEHGGVDHAVRVEALDVDHVRVGGEEVEGGVRRGRHDRDAVAVVVDLGPHVRVFAALRVEAVVRGEALHGHDPVDLLEPAHAGLVVEVQGVTLGVVGVVEHVNIALYELGHGRVEAVPVAVGGQHDGDLDIATHGHVQGLGEDGGGVHGGRLVGVHGRVEGHGVHAVGAFRGQGVGEELPAAGQSDLEFGQVSEAREHGGHAGGHLREFQGRRAEGDVEVGVHVTLQCGPAGVDELLEQIRAVLGGDERVHVQHGHAGDAVSLDRGGGQHEGHGGVERGRFEGKDDVCGGEVGQLQAGARGRGEADSGGAGVGQVRVGGQGDLALHDAEGAVEGQIGQSHAGGVGVRGAGGVAGDRGVLEVGLQDRGGLLRGVGVDGGHEQDGHVLLVEVEGRCCGVGGTQKGVGVHGGELRGLEGVGEGVLGGAHERGEVLGRPAGEVEGGLLDDRELRGRRRGRAAEDGHVGVAVSAHLFDASVGARVLDHVLGGGRAVVVGADAVEERSAGGAEVLGDQVQSAGVDVAGVDHVRRGQIVWADELGQPDFGGQEGHGVLRGDHDAVGVALVGVVVRLLVGAGGVGEAQRVVRDHVAVGEHRVVDVGRHRQRVGGVLVDEGDDAVEVEVAFALDGVRVVAAGAGNGHQAEVVLGEHEHGVLREGVRDAVGERGVDVGVHRGPGDVTDEAYLLGGLGRGRVQGRRAGRLDVKPGQSRLVRVEEGQEALVGGVVRVAEREGVHRRPVLVRHVRRHADRKLRH
eukprot:355651-Prorocentrum_minimum.AAC.10